MTNEIPYPFGQGNAPGQPGSPGGPAQNRPPTNIIGSAQAAGLSNAPANTQETVPRVRDEQNVSEETNPGLEFLETREDFAAAAAKDGLQYGFDNVIGGYRFIAKNGLPLGVTPASKKALMDYHPQQEANSPIEYANGREIWEYAESRGWKVYSDPMTGKYRYVDASGRLIGLIPTTAVDLPSPEAPDNPGTEAAKSSEEAGSQFNNDALGKVEEPPNALAVQLPLTERTLAPMPMLNRGQPTSLAKYGKGRKPKITPAMLKDRVLGSCILLVKDGVVYKYNGICYQPQDDAALQKLVIETCRAEVDENGYFDLVTGAIKFIRAEPMIQYTERTENHRVLTFQNGNLDIETGAFHQFSPKFFTTYALKCCYIPDPTRVACPEFDQFLWGISGGDTAIIARLCEAIAKLNEVLNMSTGPDGDSTSYFLATSYPFFTQWRSEAFPDRLVTIPLAGEIPEEMRSPAYFEKIIEERDAIATIAARCYDEVRRRNGGFNGYYPINSIPMLPPCEKICTNKEESVRQFAETHCERIPDTGTDTCILHDSFIKEYGYISFTEFLDLFERNARELYGAERALGSNFYDINFHSFFPYIHLRDNEF